MDIYLAIGLAMLVSGFLIGWAYSAARKSGDGPDWRILVPDGIGNTAHVIYKGTEIPVMHLNYDLPANGIGVLTLTLRPGDAEAIINLVRPTVGTEEAS